VWTLPDPASHDRAVRVPGPYRLSTQPGGLYLICFKPRFDSLEAQALFFHEPLDIPEPLHLSCRVESMSALRGQPSPGPGWLWVWRWSGVSPGDMARGRGRRWASVSSLGASGVDKRAANRAHANRERPLVTSGAV